MIRAGVHFLLAIGVFAAIVWGSMGLLDIATGSLGNAAEWRAILVFGFMGAAVIGRRLYTMKSWRRLTKVGKEGTALLFDLHQSPVT